MLVGGKPGRGVIEVNPLEDLRDIDHWKRWMREGSEFVYGAMRKRGWWRGMSLGWVFRRVKGNE